MRKLSTAPHPFISYNTMKDVHFSKTDALICFSSTVDENTDTVNLQSHIREWEENNGLINFNRELIRRIKVREIKGTRYKFKL